MTYLEFTIPVKTTNPQNGATGNSRLAAIIKTRKRADHRSTAWLCARNAMVRVGLKPSDLVPCVVTLRRVSAGSLDPDANAACMKGVQDGVAEALQIDDGGRFVEWKYMQRRGPRKAYAVEVRIERVERSFAARDGATAVTCDGGRS